ncbi:cyclin-domain-containing protein [Hysterangium stoloniferum]|nr:cyclin-domain-containing protein [Hysterangium stoloniferum]
MLAFAPPLTHTQSADGHSSTTALRPRSSTRSSGSVSVVSASTNHNGLHRTASKQSFKPPSCSIRPSLEQRRSEPSVPRSVEQQSFSAQPNPNTPSTQDQPIPSSSNGRHPLPVEKLHEQDPSKLLQLLASLLQQIASANDQIRTSSSSSPDESSSLPVDEPDSPSVHRPPIWTTLTSASRHAFSTPTSSLTFHARNIPTITLEAYLLRILKYCPTTNEVFLSLLVYFDRMSKLAFEATGKSFAIDSFNVHRLVIAGVTVASKFFSDVFYTNSRYAKVGGLPQSELNQLELQFLLLNDFRLSIAAEEMQRYAEQLQIYSRNTEAGLENIQDSLYPCTQSRSPQDMIATSMQRMGAADAYGGRLPGEPMTDEENIRETYSGVLGVLAPSASEPTESGIETEEEGGETDDEPTIRGHSSAGSETQSLCTAESDAYSEDETEEDERDGRTPER